MSRKRRSSVQKYHDRVAGRYDHSYDDAYWQWHDALTWDHLKSFLPSDQNAKILDLGCGTGKWGAKLLKSGYHVTFLDISPQMVDQSRIKAQQMGCEARADFVTADANDLSELPANEFALIVAFGEPICCTKSIPKTLKQIRRCLVDQGVLVATFDNKLAALDFYLQRGDCEETRRFIRDGKTHWLTSGEDERFPIITVDPTELRKLLENAGLLVLDLVGKTVLPMRHHRQLLAEPEDRRRWATVEKSLWRDPAAIGRAAHIQVVCRAVGS